MKKLTVLGYSFGDSLFKGKKPFGRRSLDMRAALNWREGITLVSPISKKRLGETIATDFSSWRLVPLYLLISLIFILLASRLFMLQVIEGPIFLSQAQGNGVRIKTIHAPRGVIYDRNGEVLARNRPAFRIAWDLNKTKKEARTGVITTLAPLLGMSEAEINQIVDSFDKKLEEGTQGPDPVTIKANVDRDTTLKIETKEKDLPGVITEASPIREYPYREVVAHLLGYTGEINQTELDSEDFEGYKSGEVIGKDGAEKQFEKVLRGQDGQELIKVDSTGARLGTVYTSNPLAGGDLHLSIDIGLQKKAFEALKKAVDDSESPGGSVVVSDPGTGQILALVSYPSFDNNKFAQGIKAEDFTALIEDKKTPLLNRTVAAAYPPGSTFKIISAASGLESGKITPDTKYEDTGSVTLGPITFNNWYFTQHGRKEGSVDVVKALQRSNDTYFYLMGQAVGEKPIQDYAFKFGLGQALGINLPGEVTGLVPTDEWKRKVRDEPWYPGNTLNLAIGQGDLLTTPLQVNSMTSVIGTEGKLLKPSIIKNDVIETLRSNILSPGSNSVIKNGLQKVTQTGGTAWPFFGFGVPTAGKTGTAESGDKKPHAWYTALAPTQDPQLVITVMLEKAGEGSSIASPVAKEALNWWFFERLGKQTVEASAEGERIGD
jgi:penicillin-binding protein 2